MKEKWQSIEDCEECRFKDSAGLSLGFDGKPGCKITGTLLEKEVPCLWDGLFISLPRTDEELRQVIEVTQKRWKRERVEFPGIALVK